MKKISLSVLTLCISLAQFMQGMELRKLTVKEDSEKIEEKSNNNEQSSLSFIYYLNQPDNFSHTELEVGGTSWTLIWKECGDECTNKPLDKMIKKSQSGTGYPFFRFVFHADQEHIEKVKKIIDERKGEFGLTCSTGAFYPLSQTGICNVPYPIRLGPTFSALYLTTGKKLNCNNVKQIEYYGKPLFEKETIERVYKGPLREFCYVLLFSLMAYQIIYYS